MPRATPEGALHGDGVSPHAASIKGMKLAAPFHEIDDHLRIELPGGRALFSTRRGGVSEGPFASLNLGLTGPAPPRVRSDQAAQVAVNRDRLAERVGIPAGRFAHGHQVHGSDVRRVTQPPRGAWSAPGEASAVRCDGQATALAGVATVVLTADCLPVAVIAEGAVAMVHAGWRGLARGVLGHAVAAVRELGARGPVRAAIGPGVGRCCYEVGEEVHRAFAAHGPAVREGSRLDLKLIAERELSTAGVAEVHDAGLCTMCAEPALFFSYRRDRGLTGRQGGVAWRS